MPSKQNTQNISLQLDDVAPAGGGIRALVVVLDSVGKDVGAALAVGLGVLLGAEDNGLGAMQAVDAVDDLVEAAHLLELLGIDVEKVLLDGAVRADTHDNDSSLLILVALTKDLPEHPVGCLDDADGGTGGGEEPYLLIVPVLCQVLAEHVGIQEDTHNAGYRVLYAQLLGTAGGIVRHMGSQSVEVGNHAIERAAGTDAFLFGQLLVGYYILAIQLLPRADNVDVVERLAHPVLVVLGKVESRAATQGLKTGSIAAADAPDILDGTPLKGTLALVVVVDHAAMLIDLVFLGQLRGNLG